MSGLPGIVLTGGGSRRMGTDKAFVVVDGRPMAIAVADALWEAGCHPVECQGGDLAGLASLGLDGFADERPDGGPVEAIRTASARHQGPIVAVACDLPYLDADSVAAVVAAGGAEERLAVATAAGRHHLVVFVPPGAVESEAVGRSIREWSADAIEVPIDASAVRNVNTPEDLRLDDPDR